MITGKYYRIVGTNLKNFLRKGESRKRGKGKGERRKGKGESGKWKVESGKWKVEKEFRSWIVG